MHLMTVCMYEKKYPGCIIFPRNNNIIIIILIRIHCYCYCYKNTHFNVKLQYILEVNNDITYTVISQ